MSGTSPTPASTTATPSGVVARFTDPYDYQEGLRGCADVRTAVTAAGNYQAELAQVSLFQLQIYRGWISLPRIAHTAHKKERCSIGFLTKDQQASTTLNGLEAGSEHIAFFSPGAEVYQRSFTECRWGALFLTEESLAAAARVLVGRDLTAPTDMRLLRPPPHLMSHLRHIHEAAAHLATMPDILARFEVARAIEQELLLTMVKCLAEGIPAKLESLRRRHGNLVMRRFERAVEEAQNSPLYLAEICASIGVSVRTLHQHCMDRLGVAPRRYLWLRRMNLARSALLRADPKETTVTAAANEYGFSELGRFAVAYRQLFGELPSATLRRPSTDGKLSGTTLGGARLVHR